MFGWLCMNSRLQRSCCSLQSESLSFTVPISLHAVSLRAQNNFVFFFSGHYAFLGIMHSGQPSAFLEEVLLHAESGKEKLSLRHSVVLLFLSYSLFWTMTFLHNREKWSLLNVNKSSSDQQAEARSSPLLGLNSKHYVRHKTKNLFCFSSGISRH